MPYTSAQIRAKPLLIPFQKFQRWISTLIFYVPVEHWQELHTSLPRHHEEPTSLVIQRSEQECFGKPNGMNERLQI